jgi:hypothetical protein|tara:strand:+ start:280 stop:453 length:174 start_codon:yes stop_codon:yes gene_type:complete
MEQGRGFSRSFLNSEVNFAVSGDTVSIQLIEQAQYSSMAERYLAGSLSTVRILSPAY